MGPLTKAAKRLEELTQIEGGVGRNLFRQLVDNLKTVQLQELFNLDKTDRPQATNFYKPGISLLLREMQDLKVKIKAETQKVNLELDTATDLFQAVMLYYAVHTRLYNIYFQAAHSPSSEIDLYKKGLFELEDLNLMLHKNALYLLFPSMENNFQSSLLAAKAAYHPIEKDFIEIKVSEFQKLKFETTAIEESIRDIPSYNRAIQFFALNKLLINYYGFNELAEKEIISEAVNACAPSTLIFNPPRNGIMTDLPFYKEMKQTELYEKTFYNHVPEFVEATTKFEFIQPSDVEVVATNLFKKVPKTKEFVDILIQVELDNEKASIAAIEKATKRDEEELNRMELENQEEETTEAEEEVVQEEPAAPMAPIEVVKPAYRNLKDYYNSVHTSVKEIDSMVWPMISINYVGYAVLSGEVPQRDKVIENIFESMWQARVVYAKAAIIKKFDAEEIATTLKANTIFANTIFAKNFKKEDAVASTNLDEREQLLVLNSIDQSLESLKEKTKKRFLEEINKLTFLTDLESPANVKSKMQKDFFELNTIQSIGSLPSAYIIKTLQSAGLSYPELKAMKSYERKTDWGKRIFVDNTNKQAPRSVKELSNFYQQKVSLKEDSDFYWNFKNGNPKVKVTDMFWHQLNAAVESILKSKETKENRKILEAYAKNGDRLKQYDYINQVFPRKEQEKALFKAAVLVAKKIYYGGDVTNTKNQLYWWPEDRKNFNEILKVQKKEEAGEDEASKVKEKKETKAESEQRLASFISDIISFDPMKYQAKVWKEETESQIGIVAQDVTSRIPRHRYMMVSDTPQDPKKMEELKAELAKKPETKKELVPLLSKDELNKQMLHAQDRVVVVQKNRYELNAKDAKFDDKQAQELADALNPDKKKPEVSSEKKVDKSDSLSTSEKKELALAQANERRKVMPLSDTVTSQLRNFELAISRSDATRAEVIRRPIVPQEENFPMKEAANKETKEAAQNQSGEKPKGKIVDLWEEEYREYESYGEAFYHFMNLLGLTDYVLGKKDISSGRFADSLQDQLLLAELNLNEVLGQETILNSYTDQILEVSEQGQAIGVDGIVYASGHERGHFIYKLLEAYEPLTNNVDRKKLITLIKEHMELSQKEFSGKLKDFCELNPLDYKRNKQFRNMFNSVTEVRRHLKELDNAAIGAEQRKKIEEFDVVVADKSRSFIEMLIHDYVDPLFMYLMAVTIVAAGIVMLAGPMGFSLAFFQPFLAFMGIGLGKVMIMSPMMTAMLILSLVSIMRFPINFIHKPAQVSYQESLLKTQILSKKIESLVDGKFTTLEELEKARFEMYMGQGIDSFVILLELAFFPGFVVQPIKQAIGYARANAVKRLTGLSVKPSIKNVVKAIKSGKFKKSWKNYGFESALKESFSGVAAMSRENILKVVRYALGRKAEELGMEHSLPFAYLKAIDKEIARRRLGLKTEKIFGMKTVQETVMTAKGPAIKETEQWVEIFEYHIKEHAKKDPKFYTGYQYGKDFKKWVDGGLEQTIWDPFSKESWNDLIYAAKDYMKNSSTRNLPMYVQELLHALTNGSIEQNLKALGDLARRHGPIQYFNESGELIKGSKSMLMYKFEIARGMAEAKRIKDLERHREIIMQVIRDANIDKQDILNMKDLSQESKRIAIEMYQKKEYQSLYDLGFKHETDYLQSFFNDPLDMEIFKDVVSFSPMGNPLKKFNPVMKDFEELSIFIVKPDDFIAPYNHFASENWDEFFKGSDPERYAQYRDYLIELNNHPDANFKKTIDDIDEMIK
ncbi:MAG: hypothetical protein JNM93_04075 [Bacteriovoracaceae bacterium]|nr:hypothetical protein [Bacteriovoracaceae bacterium]